jgi:hypothetical protein
MKVVSSALELASASTETRTSTREEKVRAWVGDRPPPASTQSDLVTISRTARAMALEPALQEARRAAESAQAAQVPAEEDDEAGLDPRILVLKRLVEALTGKKIKLHGLTSGQGRQQALPQAQAAQGQGTQRVGWGIEASTTETTTHTQDVAFAARGVVKTADGREITVEAEVAMHDEQVTISQATFRAGDAQLKDPLVLQFDGKAADLLGQVDFDLDADGTKESMAFVGPGAGVLTLDANGAARPKDGSALFGVRTGDGFAELAALDGDGNGWIDEGDAAYARLGVWTRDAGGTEHVQSLKEAGVGAIALAHVDTPMDVHDASGALRGRVEASGIYLGEEGGAGLAQQIDLAVRPRVSVEA